MWCFSATLLLILAVVIVSGVRFNQGSCYSFSSSTFSPASSTSERVVAAHKPEPRKTHVAVAVAVAVVVVTIIPVIATAAVAVSTHARAIVSTTCRVLDDDSVRRVCWAHLLPASD